MHEDHYRQKDTVSYPLCIETYQHEVPDFLHEQQLIARL